MANRELDAKRAQAAYLTKRANHKISRLRRTAEVEVAGSQYDPRKPRKALNRYTAKQLDAYMARVSQFNDRSTQFVGDMEHRPIPSSEWRDYKRAETAHRNHMQDRLNQIKDLRLPGIDGRPGSETIGQRRAKMVSDRRLAGNPTVHDPFDPPIREPRNIKNRDKLKELTRSEKKKAVKGWDNAQLAIQVEQFSKMIKRVGDKGLAAKVAALSPERFFTLWNGTGFAGAIGTEYEQMMLMLEGKEQPYHAQLVRDAFQDAHRYVDWAATVNMTTAQKNRYRKNSVRDYMVQQGFVPETAPKIK
jgi:hypothetical protein